MIAARLEKIKFIVDEMQVAFYLTTAVHDPFFARMLARHVLVRAKDFIAHTRGLRRPLNDAGYDSRKFHNLKEIYAKTFDEYFTLARHRLGAHVQDLDFGRRIELWKDIEVSKVEYFSEGAIEIYSSLASFNLPSYQTYCEPSVIRDQAVSTIFENYRRSNSQPQGIEMASDSLAITRKNTSAAINNTPIHARAGQLALVRRWVKMQTDLLSLLDSQLSISRVLKARILTDIVSFCDCLVTRSVTNGAPQQMDGLDVLLVGANQSSLPIDNFVSATNFHIELRKIRDVRDQIGAHLEIDPTKSLFSVMNTLDTVNIGEAIKFYQGVDSVFTKVCNNVLFLRMYAIDGQRMHVQGIRTSSKFAVPYADDDELSELSIEGSDAPVYDNDEVYNESFQRWLHGDEDQKAEVRHFFWNAFLSSSVVEQLEEVEQYGASKQFKRYDFRTAHEFILSVLSEDLNSHDFRGALELITSCSSGSPYLLSEVLIRYAPLANNEKKLLICSALGEIVHGRHEAVNQFLQNLMMSYFLQIRLQSRLAVFKRYIGIEGIYRANHKGQIMESFDDVVTPMLDSLQNWEKLFCLLIFASALCVSPSNIFHKQFETNYTAFQLMIKEQVGELIELDANDNDVLKTLVHSHDYVGVCLHIVNHLDGGTEHPIYSVLLDFCCDGTIRAFSSDQSLRHLAICHHLRQQYSNAYALALQLALRNPEKAISQIFITEMQIGSAENPDVIAQRLGEIKHRYLLSVEEENRIAEIESHLAGT